MTKVRAPLAGDVPVASWIDTLVQRGELYEPLPGAAVRCNACGHRCKIKPGARGICQVRYNQEGELKVPFGYVAALQCDPTEKKPFYHVYPGSDTLTFGMLGCDLRCSYCQNWDISQALRDPAAGRPVQQITADELVQIGVRSHARCVASSYNEPLITSEWAAAVFRPAKEAGLTCLYVSNGNGTREVLEYLRPFTTGYKIDLKSMRDKSYRSLGAVLGTVLDTIRMAHEMGYWVEIVTLVVPGFNSSEEELRDAAEFIKSVSPDIPWHVTAFHKDYRMTDPANTDAQLLQRAAEIGYEAGLHYVYAGNVPGRVGQYEHTFCPNCHKAVIERIGYVVLNYTLTPKGACPHCATPIAGVWPTSKHEVRTGTYSDLFSRRPRPAR